MSYIVSHVDDSKIKKEANRVKDTLGYYPNIRNPKSFSEKILWRKLFDHDPIFTKTADKFLVKDFLIEEFGDSFKKYIIPTLYSTNNPADIPFEELTYPCIIKANNGSGTNIILESISDVNKEEIYTKCNKWLTKKYGQKKFEWAYVDIKPKIIIEPFINTVFDKLYDYRFFVFHGNVKVLFVDRGSNDKLRNIYNRDFKLQSETVKYPNYKTNFSKPKNFDEMIVVAETIGSLFDFCRVDLYNLDGTIYFGETTHYTGSGNQKFSPTEYDYTLGSYWDIDVKK